MKFSIKLVIAAFILQIIIPSVFGNTIDSVFLKNSLLSVKIQALILDELNNNCSSGISAYGLTENSSRIESVVLNGDKIEKDFITELSSRYYFDGYHPTYQRIVIRILESQNNSDGEVMAKLLKVEGQCDNSGL
jgi:hypothetical protein